MSMKRSASPPPSYCEEQQIPYIPRPITSGPTEYNGLGMGIVYLHWLLCGIAKIVAVVVMAHCSKSSNCAFMALGVMLNFFNFWSYLYAVHLPYLTLQRLKLGSRTYCYSGLILFLLDSGMLTATICKALMGVDEKVARRVPTNCPFFSCPAETVTSYVNKGITDLGVVILVTAGSLLLFSLLLFIAIHRTEITEYDPRRESGRFEFHGRNETSALRQKPLTVRESGAFRIVVENCGIHPWSGPIRISRSIRWRQAYRNGVQPASETVSFAFFPQDPLSPGERWTFIPETHSEAGSIPIRGYRAFGRDRGVEVKTTVSKANAYTDVVTLTEQYMERM